MDRDLPSKFTKDLEHGIFALMELMHQNYDTIIDMPFSTFNKMLKFKIDLEEEKAKKIKQRQKK